MNHSSVCCLFHIACKPLSWASPLLPQMAAVLSGVVHNGVSQTGGVSGELRELPGAHSLCGSSWQDLGRVRSDRDQPPLPPPTEESLREHHLSGHGTAVGAGSAGRAQKPCKLNQEAVASTWQKGKASPSSAPSMTDEAAQVLWGERADTQESDVGCALQKGEVSTPLERCTQAEELLWLLTWHEREKDHWNFTLFSLWQAWQADRMYNTEDSLSTFPLAEHSYLRDRE